MTKSLRGYTIQNAESKNPLKWEPILTVTDFFDSLKRPKFFGI